MSGQPETRLYRVTTTLEGRNPKQPDYPLLPGDIIQFTGVRDGWIKHAPGLGVFGFVLSKDDIATLEPASDARWVIA